MPIRSRFRMHAVPMAVAGVLAATGGTAALALTGTAASGHHPAPSASQPRDLASESPEATETPEASEAPEATETPEATEAPEASEAAESDDASKAGDEHHSERGDGSGADEGGDGD